MMAQAVSNNNTSLVIRGRVERLFCSRPGFTTGIVRQNDGASIRFKDPFTVAEGDFVIFQGRMTKTDWGPQLEVAKFEPDMDLDLDGLVRFLALSKAFKGIGQARAREIANRFGNDFDHVVTEEPERLMEIKGITREIMEGVQEEWLQRRSQGKVIAYLSGFGLTPFQVDKLMEKLGNSALAVVKENPYILIELVDGFGFRRVDDIALKTGTEKDAPGRIRAGVLYALQKASEDGHTCQPFDNFEDAAIRLLTLDSDDSFELLAEIVDRLVAEGKLTRFNGKDGAPYIALTGLFNMEIYLARVFETWGRP